MNLAILVPTHDRVPALFAYDLARMYARTVAEMPETTRVALYFEIGTYVHLARESLLRQAINDGAHYALFVDSDMRLPSDTFLRLLAHGRPCVGINYAKREIPTSFVAIKRVPFEQGEVGERLVTREDSTGLEDVDAMGFGACLLETAAVRRLDDEKRWFWFESRWPGDHVGEDVYFFRALREVGIQPQVDHDLSRECGHIGDFTLTTAHATLELPE
jgi:hypothetical protein